jgi:pimeloyl-ACP methyl ester carboxylesterase
VRQPEVARLSALAAALLLVVPVVLASRRLLLAGAFLAEFLGEGARAPLSWLTAAPARTPLPLTSVAADRYAAAGLAPGHPLVLVHGFAPEGKDDPRVVRSAELLARAGFEVVVPAVSGLTAGRLRPADVDTVVTAITAAGARAVRVIAVSVGAGPALLAAADPRVRDRVSTVLVLGGYASAVELLRFFLTGEYGFGQTRGNVAHDPELVRAFVAANGDLVDAPTRQALLAGNRQQVAAFLDNLPADLRALLETLSPERVAGDIPARLVLVHGRADRAVPYTESVRLAAARPARTTLVLVGLVDHVQGPGGLVAPPRADDLLALWGVVSRLLAEE